MGTFNLRSWSLVSFLLLLTLFAATSTQLNLNPIKDNICEKVCCGVGTCYLSPSNVFGFNCNCIPGWKKLRAGPIELPFCFLPDCSIDLHCGNGLAPSPSPFVEVFRPELDVSDPCVFAVCGDGKCVTNGTDFSCQCNKGAKNFRDDPRLMCLKKCSLGRDCDLYYWLSAPLPAKEPPPPAIHSRPFDDLPPPPSISAFAGEKLNGSRILLFLILTITIILLVETQYCT